MTSIASLHSASLVGVQALAVRVEVHLSMGIPGYNVVGLPDTAVRESKERVRAALLSTGIEWASRRITVNLAPANLRKTGAGLELAMALGLLLTKDHLPQGCLDDIGVVGELGLDGSVRPVPGTLALVDALRCEGIRRVIVPRQNAVEARLLDDVEVLPARSLAELCACLKDEFPWPDIPDVDFEPPQEFLDLGDVRGLPMARRALEVAAAGRHHVLFFGPPGAGKTMLAMRLPSILPPLQPQEALEVTRIHSIAGTHNGKSLIQHPPFRAPHHSASLPALVGGGSQKPHPGEVTLAHRGALFLDELGEFEKRTLDALRQPLESHSVLIARQPLTIDFPADFLLIACTNPCPCGRQLRDCVCSDSARAKYYRRLSLPFLDRFDIRLTVSQPNPNDSPGESSKAVRARVIAARDRQAHRYEGKNISFNSQAPSSVLSLELTEEVRATWRASTQRCSGRGTERVLRVARTLADLDDSEAIHNEHVLLAATLREELQ